MSGGVKLGACGLPERTALQLFGFSLRIERSALCVPVIEDGRDSDRKGVDIAGKAPALLTLRVPRTGASSVRRDLTLVPAAETGPIYDKLSRSLQDACSTSGVVHGKEFSEGERRALREAVQATLPLLRCENNPVKRFARTNELARECKTGHTAGQWFTGGNDTVFLADSPNDFKGVTVHEVAHAALQSHDPRTCTNYPLGDSPLVREYGKLVGWSPDGKTLTNPPNNVPPTDYAKTSVIEDMADSLEEFINDPKTLRAVSQLRYDFYAKLMQQLRTQAPPAAPAEKAETR